MNYIERDKKARRQAFWIGFAMAIGAMAYEIPDFSVRRAAVLAAVVGVLAMFLVEAYQGYLNHLADDLAEKRNSRMAALAIDD